MSECRSALVTAVTARSFWVVEPGRGEIRTEALPELAADEIAVRVPIRVSWAGRARLFGDELLFRLQPAGTRYEIAEITEDFRLP